MFLVLESPASGVAKVSLVTRCIAKSLDLCITIFLSVLFPHLLGVLLGLLYTLLHDGLFQGQSLGKRVCQLKVIHLKGKGPCSFRESAIRNSPLAVASFFAMIPFWGWILAILLGIPLVLLEIYLMITHESGGRLGDVMADTKVVEAPRSLQKIQS